MTNDIDVSKSRYSTLEMIYALVAAVAAELHVEVSRLH